MACYHPRPAWQLLGVKTASGKSVISFKDPYAVPNRSRVGIMVPCGNCIGCRLDKAQSWAIRGFHENQRYDFSSFISLTFSDDHLDPARSLIRSDFPNFMKRLRKHFQVLTSAHCEYSEHGRLRVKRKYRPFDFTHLYCGEYGEDFSRPHYHACLFGVEFADKYYWRTTDTGSLVYRSPTLERLWPFGHCEIGSVTIESISYVARYILKKINGDAAHEHYRTVDDYNQEVDRTPEFLGMSTRPAIGKRFIEEFSSDVFPNDCIVLPDGSKGPVPRYYRQRFNLTNPEVSDKLRLKRVERAQASPDNSPERLAVREACKQAKVKDLKRSL